MSNAETFRVSNLAHIISSIEILLMIHFVIRPRHDGAVESEERAADRTVVPGGPRFRNWFEIVLA